MTWDWPTLATEQAKQGATSNGGDVSQSKMQKLEPMAMVRQAGQAGRVAAALMPMGPITMTMVRRRGG